MLLRCSCVETARVSPAEDAVSVKATDGSSAVIGVMRLARGVECRDDGTEMRDLRRLAWERIVEIVRRPGNLILAVGVTILLGVFAAPGEADPNELPLVVSGRLFLLVTGISGLFGYTFSALRRLAPEVATDEIVSLRAFVLGRVLSSAALAGCLTWIAVALMLVVTFLRYGAGSAPEGWVIGYAFVGPWIVGAAFAGAMTMARRLLRRGGRTAVAWILFLPWMLTFAAFRLLGGLPAAPSRVVILALACAVALCAVEAAIFLRFVPDRLTMRPR